MKFIVKPGWNNGEITLNFCNNGKITEILQKVYGDNAHEEISNLLMSNSALEGTKQCCRSRPPHQTTTSIFWYANWRGPTMNSRNKHHRHLNGSAYTILIERLEWGKFSAWWGKATVLLPTAKKNSLSSDKEGVKISKHFLGELEQEMKHGFPGTIHKTMHRATALKQQRWTRQGRKENRYDLRAWQVSWAFKVHFLEGQSSLISAYWESR